MDSLDSLKRFRCQLRAGQTTKKPNAAQRKAKVAATIVKLQAIRDKPKDQ
ncbi:hypothetical protein JNB91_18020 [Rhizobium wenxiniae]|nr:hypothetical protein [Rhizobium wenxiniae]MBW9089720.1 hypothetical protein [Rhizobium wenxiniae]